MGELFLTFSSWCDMFNHSPMCATCFLPDSNYQGKNRCILIWNSDKIPKQESISDEGGSTFYGCFGAMQPPPPLGNSISGKKVRYFRDERTVSYSYSSIPCSSSSRRRRSMNDVTIATAAKRRELDSHAAVAMAARHNSVLFFWNEKWRWQWYDSTAAAPRQWLHWALSLKRSWEGDLDEG